MNWKVLWTDLYYVVGEYPFQLLAVFVVGVLVGIMVSPF
jgi:hypothetical protein